MQRLRLCHQSNNAFAAVANSNDGHLNYLRIDDNGTIVAVFKDNSEIDISELFPQAVLDDYKEHHILESC